MATPPSPSLHIDLWAILSESKRIINAHSRHFLALSVLFLLPLSFSFSFSLSLSAYPAINQLFPQSSTPTLENHLSFLNNPFQQQQPPFFPIKILIFTLLYTLFIFIFIFFLFATGSITYSVVHGFYGRPVKLVSAIKSAFTSLFHIVSTCVVSELIISGILLILGLVLFSLVKATQLLGFQVNFTSPYFISLCLVFLIIFVSIVAYLQVNWVFAYVVVVVYNLAASTVFYMYSKAIHGELAGEIAEESAREYVSLPSNDGKVPHVVSVVYG